MDTADVWFQGGTGPVLTHIKKRTHFHDPHCVYRIRDNMRFSIVGVFEDPADAEMTARRHNQALEQIAKLNQSLANLVERFEDPVC